MSEEIIKKAKRKVETIIESIEHWERMSEWVWKTRGVGHCVMPSDMHNAIGETWDSLHCSLCQEYGKISNDHACNGCPLYEKYGECGRSGDNPYRSVSASTIWGKWLDGATKMIQALKNVKLDALVELEKVTGEEAKAREGIVENKKLNALNESIAHWKRMYEWVGKKKGHPGVDLIEMNDEIGEDWSGEHCALCSEYSGGWNCGESKCPLKEKYGKCGKQSPGNPWYAIQESMTWGQWYGYASRMIEVLTELRDDELQVEADAKMSREQALRLTKELWQWLAEDIRRNKHDWPEFKKYGHMHSECPCCEYDHQNSAGPALGCEKRCLLKSLWPGGCTWGDSPYNVWNSRSNNDSTRVAAATQIWQAAARELGDSDVVTDYANSISFPHADTLKIPYGEFLSGIDTKVVAECDWPNYAGSVSFLANTISKDELEVGMKVKCVYKGKSFTGKVRHIRSCGTRAIIDKGDRDWTLYYRQDAGIWASNLSSPINDVAVTKILKEEWPKYLEIKDLKELSYLWHKINTNDSSSLNDSIDSSYDPDSILSVKKITDSANGPGMVVWQKLNHVIRNIKPEKKVCKECNQEIL